MSDESAALRNAYRDGKLSWVRGLALLPLTRNEALAASWVERAKQVTVRRLVDEVAWVLERSAAGDVLRQPLDPPPLGAPLEPVQMRVNGEHGKADHSIEFWGPASIVSTLERLSIAWSEPDEPLWKGLVRVVAQAARQWEAEGRRHRDPIVERDHYRCLAPACGSRRNLQAHHFVFRSAGGSDEPQNLGTLCAGHHLRCLHLGTIRARGRAPDAIEWELGIEYGKAPLARLRADVYACGCPS